MFSPKKLTTQSSFTTSTSTPNTTTTTTSNKPASATNTRTSSTQPTLGRGIKTLSMTSTSTVPSYDGFNQPMLNGSSSITSPTAAAAASAAATSRTKGLKASNRTKSSINSPNPIRRTRSKLLSATSSNASSTSTALTGLTVSAPGSPSNATTSSSYVQPPSPSSNLSVSPKKPLTVNTSAPPSPTAGVTSTFSPQPDAYPSVPSSPIASASPTARRMKSHQSRLAAFPAPSTSTSTTSGNQPSITSPTGAQAQAQQQKKTVLPRKLDTSLSAEADTHQQQPSPKTTLFSPLYKLHDEDGKEIKVDGESKRGSTGAVQPKVKATRKDKKLDAQAAREVEAANAAAQQVYQHQHAHHHHVVYATTEQPTPDPQHTTVVPTVSYTPVIEEDDFDPFLFIKNLPPLSPAVRNRRSPLPKKLKTAPRISLALDLDETLVHCSVQPIEKAELTFSVSFNGLDYEVYVRTRPHLKEFLETVSQWFEIIVFTASQKVYADKLLNILDPHSKYIQHRVFRDSCVCIDGNYLKDLTILGRDLPTVAIVDNSVQAFGFQLDNGIPIESWFDDDQDRELLNLLPFLQNLKEAKDVRPIIRDTFRLQEFVNSL